MTPSSARAALSHPACCGLSRARLGDLIEELAGPWTARGESELRERRGGDRRRAPGAGPHHTLVFLDRLLVTLVVLRFQLPHAVLAQFYGVHRVTVTRAVGEVRPLLASRGFAVPGHLGVRLRTLADVFAYAHTEGIALRIDGTEVQVRRPAAARPPPGPVGGRSCPVRRDRTPRRRPVSATGRADCCGPGRIGPGGCTTRPRCAAKASPSSSACTRRCRLRLMRATGAWQASSPIGQRPATQTRAQHVARGPACLRPDPPTAVGPADLCGARHRRAETVAAVAALSRPPRVLPRDTRRYRGPGLRPGGPPVNPTPGKYRPRPRPTDHLLIIHWSARQADTSRPQS